jgi:hypothetical protein
VSARTWAISLIAGVVFGTTLLSSCSSKSRPATTEGTPTDQIVSSTPPFQTKEPAHYQAIRTITFTDSSGTSTVTKTAIARYDELRREETEKFVLLDSEQGRVVLLPDAKIYAEVNGSISGESGTEPQELDSSPERLLHQEQIATTYQKLGTESTSGRNTTKYRVIVNTPSSGNVSSSETLIWIDETVGMPIKSETKANDGSRTLMEISNIGLDVDKGLFRIPAGYERVAAAELRRRLSKN